MRLIRFVSGGLLVPAQAAAPEVPTAEGSESLEPQEFTGHDDFDDAAEADARALGFDMSL